MRGIPRTTHWAGRLIAGAVLLTLASAAEADGWIFLVRHAEKAGEHGDVPLSEAGVDRAEALSSMLIDAGIGAIYSTDTLRTQATADPLAKRLGLEVRLYDPTKLPELAAALRSSESRTLVVGHSNTTPELVELLGGEAGSPIALDEYDRLYLLLLGRDGVDTVLLRLAP